MTEDRDDSRPKGPSVREGEAHRLNLLDLGFPPEVAAEAGRAVDLGLFDMGPSPDLVERTIAHIEATGIWDRPPFAPDREEDR